MKYKNLVNRGEVPLSDVYQVAFYSRLLGTDEAILVYPSVGSYNRHTLFEAKNINRENSLEVHIIGYDLSRVIESGTIDHGFVSEVEQVLGEKPR